MQPQRHQAEQHSQAFVLWESDSSGQMASWEGSWTGAPLAGRHLYEGQAYPACCKERHTPPCTTPPPVIICGCPLSRKRPVMVSLKRNLWPFFSPVCRFDGPRPWHSWVLSAPWPEKSVLCMELSLCIAHFAKWQSWICHNMSQTKWWLPAHVCGASSLHTLCGKSIIR